MTTQTTQSIDSTAGPALATSIAELVDRSGDLKRELITYAQGPRFAGALDARLNEAVGSDGFLDEARAVSAIDHFVLQHRLSGGRTLVERFVAQRRPRLSDDEREMLLGWQDVVEACFEVRRFEGDAVLLHNLFDDLVYRVYSNLGRGVFAQLRKGMFVVGRIVPVHPATDAWLVSGHFAIYPKSGGRQLAKVVTGQLTGHPEVFRRNPAMLRRAWEMQAAHRAEFIAQVGSDLAVLPPARAQETMCEHYRRLQGRAKGKRAGKAYSRAGAAGPKPEDLAAMPDDLLTADSVGLIYDEVEGLNFYRDFGRLDTLFADPSLARDRTHPAQLREYLRDDSVSPLAIRRLVQRHPEGADPVFRALLRKPGFSWSRDGEQVLRRYKKSFLDREPTPSVSPIGNRLAELLGHR